MRTLARHIIARTYKPLLERYLSTNRPYSYKGIVLDIPPTVFHPGFFGSTDLLLQQLQKLSLQGKSVLELGAGSGLLSLVAARSGAVVTASDINHTAITCLKTNAAQNNLEVSVIHSDLFGSIPAQSFDLILINPPYYRGAPRNEKDYAWYCGEKGEYFTGLFRQLAPYTHSHTIIYMTLCEDCAIGWIAEQAAGNGWQLHCVCSCQNLIERHYLFELKRRQTPNHIDY